MSFFLSPLVAVFRDNKPCVICSSVPYFEWLRFLHLSQIHSSRLPIFWLVLLLSFESVSNDKPRIPLNGFSGPSVWALGGDLQGLSLFQFLLWFNPVCGVARQHVFITFFRASFYVFNPVF